MVEEAREREGALGWGTVDGGDPRIIHTRAY